MEKIKELVVFLKEEQKRSDVFQKTIEELDIMYTQKMVELSNKLDKEHKEEIKSLFGPDENIVYSETGILRIKDKYELDCLTLVTKSKEGIFNLRLLTVDVENSVIIGDYNREIKSDIYSITDFALKETTRAIKSIGGYCSHEENVYKTIMGEEIYNSIINTEDEQMSKITIDKILNNIVRIVMDCSLNQQENDKDSKVNTESSQELSDKPQES